MIHSTQRFLAENASPWPAAIVPREVWEPANPIRKSGLGLWRGIAIGLPISIGIWGAIGILLVNLI